MSDDDIHQKSSVDAGDLPPGTIISLTKRLQVGERLGEGGMGKVFRAFDPIMNRHIALKVMKVDVPESEQRRFRREARLCAGFRHPNLVGVLDVGRTVEHGLFWFAMEFLDGTDLAGPMESGQPLPLPLVIEVIGQVLDALRYVHRRGIVHRDIKPANIFLTRDGYDPDLRLVKLLDFGVAKDLNDPSMADEGNLILGDPCYLAPEQSRPGTPLDGRADLYALGMTFYQALTGHHPFEDVFHEHPRELIRCHREREPAPPSTYLPSDTPYELAQAIDGFYMAACAKDVNHRFTDAHVMKRVLSTLAAM